MTEAEYGHEVSHLRGDDAVMQLFVSGLITGQRIEVQLFGGKIQGDQELRKYIRSDQSAGRADRFLVGDIDQSVMKFDAPDADALGDAPVAGVRFQAVA